MSSKKYDWMPDIPMAPPTIGTTEFAKGRHVPGSGYSYFTGSWEQLEGEVLSQFIDERPGHTEGVWPGQMYMSHMEGYTAGVLVVPIHDAHKFRSTLYKLQEGDSFFGVYAPRMPGEEPRKQLFTIGEPEVAKTVQIILYSSKLLAADGDNSLPPEEGNWEIVTILASTEDHIKEMPMDPDTLMHNHFEASGGTATGMSDSEFVDSMRESFEFWRTRALRTGSCPSDDIEEEKRAWRRALAQLGKELFPEGNPVRKAKGGKS